jgi:hypothetical protein
MGRNDFRPILIFQCIGRKAPFNHCKARTGRPAERWVLSKKPKAKPSGSRVDRNKVVIKG